MFVAATAAAVVFVVCFPAFTGIIAGVGLSGDLKNPRQGLNRIFSMGVGETETSQSRIIVF